ncbi:MAG: hypothetical protein AB1568_13765 [Thermodesulfobacteriota bacterium]
MQAGRKGGKARVLGGMLLLACCLPAGSVPAGAGEISLAAGAALFGDPALGGSRNPTSCATCHPGGKGLENAAKRQDLAKMVNDCLSRPLQGRALPETSAEMQSLLLYLRSLAR